MILHLMSMEDGHEAIYATSVAFAAAEWLAKQFPAQFTKLYGTRGLEILNEYAHQTKESTDDYEDNEQARLESERDTPSH
jgi:hypothetical protein